MDGRGVHLSAAAKQWDRVAKQSVVVSVESHTAVLWKHGDVRRHWSIALDPAFSTLQTLGRYVRKAKQSR